MTLLRFIENYIFSPTHSSQDLSYELEKDKFLWINTCLPPVKKLDFNPAI